MEQFVTPQACCEYGFPEQEKVEIPIRGEPNGHFRLWILRFVGSDCQILLSRLNDLRNVCSKMKQIEID